MRELSKSQSAAKENWLENLDKIQDSTRRNYFSVLPEEKRLLEYFSDAFVINSPKGRVGGDGFWLHSSGPDVYLALFTCVGEGHLASMMIRIYMEALKKRKGTGNINLKTQNLMLLIQISVLMRTMRYAVTWKMMTSQDARKESVPKLIKNPKSLLTINQLNPNLKKSHLNLTDLLYKYTTRLKIKNLSEHQQLKNEKSCKKEKKCEMLKSK